MITYWILYFYVLITTLLCSIKINEVIHSLFKSTLLLLLVSTLILFSGFKGLQVDPDSSNYIEWFHNLKETEVTSIYEQKDPAFYIIGTIVSALGLGVSYLFLTYAIIAIFSKLFLINITSYYRYSHLFIYLYFCRFYFVHDMTQIRVGVAIALGSIALIICYQTKKFYLSILTFLLAMAFHFSIILISPFFVLFKLNYNFKSKVIPFVLLSFALLFYFAQKNIINILNLESLDRFSLYLNGTYEIKHISLLSVYLIIKLLILLIILFNWNSLMNFDRLIAYLVITGLFFQISFMNIEAISLRAAEVFSIFDLFLFIMPIKYISKNFTRTYFFCIIMIGAVFFRSSLKIMNSYTFA